MFLTLKKEAIKFLSLNLKNQDLRGDYKEAIALSLLFLGEKIENYAFKAPQSMSKARWMSRLIYGLKLYLLQDNFQLSSEELKRLEVFCIFGTIFYLKNWLRTPFVTEAANDDLQFFKNMELFKKLDKQCSEAVLKKITGHTWYLSGELIGLSLFSKNVSNDTKRKIVAKMTCITPNWDKRQYKSVKISKSLNIPDFVNSATRPALEALGIDLKKLFELDPKFWDTSAVYKEGQLKLSNLTVINDVAERNVKLGSGFSDFGTKNEDGLQQMFQNVAHIRKKHTKIDKKHLKKSMQSSVLR